MARDVALATEPVPTVRFFTWERSAMSLGWKQTPPAWLQMLQPPTEVVERPTGGGIAFHGSDVSIAVIVPRSWTLSLHRLMGAVCRSASRLCEAFGAQPTCHLDEPAQGRVTYCLTQPSAYAVSLEGRKVAGFALRRYPQTWLVQGSLLVRPLPAALRDALPQDVAAQLAARAVPLAEAVRAAVSEAEVIARWRNVNVEVA